MKDNYEIIPVGIYQKQSVFYDKSSQKLLLRIDKKESSYSQSFLVMIILFMLPIVRWLNQYLFINILLFLLIKNILKKLRNNNKIIIKFSNFLELFIKVSYCLYNNTNRKRKKE